MGSLLLHLNAADIGLKVLDIVVDGRESEVANDPDVVPLDLGGVLLFKLHVVSFVLLIWLRIGFFLDVIGSNVVHIRRFDFIVIAGGLSAGATANVLLVEHHLLEAEELVLLLVCG